MPVVWGHASPNLLQNLNAETWHQSDDKEQRYDHATC